MSEFQKYYDSINENRKSAGELCRQAQMCLATAMIDCITLERYDYLKMIIPHAETLQGLKRHLPNSAYKPKPEEITPST